MSPANEIERRAERTRTPAVARSRAWPLAAVLGAAFVVLLALAVTTTSLVAARLEGDKERLRSEEFLRRKAEQYASFVAVLLDRRMRTLELVATRPEWADLGKAKMRAADMLALLRPSVAGEGWTAFVDARGSIVAASAPGLEGQDVSGRAWYSDGLRSAAVRDARAEQGAGDAAGPAVSRGLVTLVHPVQDAQGRVIGVLAERIDAGTLEQLAALDALARGVSFDYGVAVVDEDGTVRVASERIATRLPPPSQLARADRNQWREVSTDAAPALLLAASSVPGGETTRPLGWWAVAFASREDVQKSIADVRRRSLLLGAGVGLLLLPIVLLLADRIARPVRRLTTALGEMHSLRPEDTARVPVGGWSETVALGETARALFAGLVAREGDIRRSADRYRALFEIHPLPMWVFDEQTLGFLEVNRAAVRKYGYSREEFARMTVLDVQPEDARPAALQALRDAEREPHEWALWRHRLRSGEIVHVETNSQQIRWFGCNARIATMLDVTEQRRAALQVLRHRRELSALAGRLMTAEESERRVLAQVLHDHYAPTLYGIKLSIEALLARTSGLGDANALRAESTRVLAPAIEALGESLGGLRGLMSDLRPPLLADHGLRAALRHEIERRRTAAAGVEIVFSPAPPSADGQRLRQQESVEYAVFMIAREALQNALAHAAATRIEVGLVEEEGGVRLTVRDDGRGFDSTAVPPAGHLGMVGMRERARWINAELVFESRPGAGTEVLLQWRARPMPSLPAVVAAPNARARATPTPSVATETGMRGA